MRIPLPVVLLSLCAFATAQSPLTTLFASNNGGAVGGGVYFDLNVTNPAGITITQIDLNTATAGAVTLDVLTISGTRTGNQTNVAAWTGPSSLGNAFTGSGVANTPSSCLLATPLTLPAGSWGVAFRAVGFAHSYTNGTGANQNYSNADLALAAGEASNVAFTGGLFTPRVVNCAIHYSPGGGGTVLASATPYGTGCVARFASYYEWFQTTPSIDLSNTAISMINTGSGYIVLPGTTTFVAPSATATNLALGDDTSAPVTLSAPFNYPGGSTTSLTVCSNGFVSTASNGTSYQPTPTAFLGWANTAWAVWRDFYPTAAGADNVYFEEVGGIGYITWLNVVGYQGTAQGTVPSTFQFQFDTATGSVHYVFQTMDTTSVSTWAGGEGWVVGYSPGGASADPGSVDLTAVLPSSIVVAGADILPLSLAVSPRPIVNTSINFTTGNITPTTPFGAVTLGLTQLAPPFDLTAFGMPGCFQYHDNLVVLLYLPLGAPSVVTPFTVPNLVGLHVQAQSYNYDPAAALTPLGAVSSRAIDLLCGDY